MLDTRPVNDALERIQRGIGFIEVHLFERPSLATIAAKSRTSPWHFHRVFVALTGETPASYVWKRQLSEICRRLVSTRQPLVDVALDSGFESQASFTRAFTRHVGVSLARFRRAGIVSPTYRYAPLDLDALTAWRRMRAGELDPTRLGLSELGLAGAWFVAGAVMLDTAALNKEEMLPWEKWSIGRDLVPGSAVPAEWAERLDEVAAALAGAPDGSVAERVYRDQPWLRVTPKLVSLAGGTPVEVASGVPA